MLWDIQHSNSSIDVQRKQHSTAVKLKTTEGGVSNVKLRTTGGGVSNVKPRTTGGGVSNGHFHSPHDTYQSQDYIFLNNYLLIIFDHNIFLMQISKIAAPGVGRLPPIISIYQVININDWITILFFSCSLIIFCITFEEETMLWLAVKISKMAACLEGSFWLKRTPPNISIWHVINISDRIAFFSYVH